MRVEHFSTGTWGGFPHFQCNYCDFDAMNLDGMRRHLTDAHRKLDLVFVSPDEGWFSDQPKMPVTVVMSLLTWDNGLVGVENLQAMVREAELLRGKASAHVIHVDNGSSNQADYLGVPGCEHMLFKHNMGAAWARNSVVAVALAVGADYLLMVDGDVTVVPFSSYAMTRFAQGRRGKFGCIGAFSSNFSDKVEEVNEAWPVIPDGLVRTRPGFAWTQYGLFNMDVFKSGIRFDENPVFLCDGWGLEDSDLYLQMARDGWDCLHFLGMKYLHRNIRSSVTNIRNNGDDPDKIYEKRKRYLLDKWKGVSGELAEFVRQMEGQHVPRVM